MVSVFRNTWKVLDEKERKRFTVLIVLDIVISVVDILSLVLLLRIVQFYIQPGQDSKPFFLPGWLNDKNSVVFIAIFFVLFGAKNICAYVIGKALYKFVGKVAVRISANSLINYQRAEFDEFVNTDSSVHIRRIAFQPFEFSQYMLSGLQQIITQFALIIITVIAIILFNAKLFLLLLLILLPPVILVFYIIKKRLTTARKNIRSSNERSYKYLLDALKGYVEANIYDRNEFFLQRFINSRRSFSTDLFDSLSLQNMPSRFIEIFAVLGLFILIAIAKWTDTTDSASLITIGAFMAAAYKIIPGIVKIINVSGQIRTYEFSIADMTRDNPGGKAEHPQLPPAEVSSLKLKRVSFHYGDQVVLNNFSLELHKGDFIGLTGASGRGKTTILNLLLGFLEPSAGEIYVNGNYATKEELKNYWPNISYARQQPFFIHDSILRNITLQETGYNDKDLQLALDVSGLKDFISKFPEGLDKIITENGKNISGGQQQRIVIARALYKNAGLILLDEPFNELDEASTHSILGHLRELSSVGKTIIMITHDQKSLSYCNKVISLDEQR